MIYIAPISLKESGRVVMWNRKHCRVAEKNDRMATYPQFEFAEVREGR